MSERQTATARGLEARGPSNGNGTVWAAMRAIGRWLWPGRGPDGMRMKGLAGRLAAVEMRLDELEAAVEARRSGEVQDGSEASMGEEMSEGAGDPSISSGAAGTFGASEACASRSDAGTRDAGTRDAGTRDAGTREDGGQSPQFGDAELAGTVPGRGEEMDGEGEMLEKARGSAGAGVAVAGGDGVGVEEQVDVRPGMPQGIPGQQARRKAARIWEGVL